MGWVVRLRMWGALRRPAALPAHSSVPSLPPGPYEMAGGGGGCLVVNRRLETNTYSQNQEVGRKFVRFVARSLRASRMSDPQADFTALILW